jgi:DNA helicase HerA-like ATPase
MVLTRWQDLWAMDSLNGIPFVPYTEFYETLDWKQGEHLSVFGRTGTGKTFLTTDILNIRTGYTVAYGVKPDDESLDFLINKEGYERITTWPPRYTQDGTKRFVLWPHIERIEDIDNSEPLFKRATGEIYAQRGWCLYVDEVRYMVSNLNLQKELVNMWILGRSSKLTLVACSQRPTWVPLEMLTQATHLFIFSLEGEDDLKRLRHISGYNKDLIISTITELPEHHCLYLNKVTRELVITKAEKR